MFNTALSYIIVFCRVGNGGSFGSFLAQKIYISVIDNFSLRGPMLLLVDGRKRNATSQVDACVCRWFTRNQIAILVSRVKFAYTVAFLFLEQISKFVFAILIRVSYRSLMWITFSAWLQTRRPPLQKIRVEGNNQWVKLFLCLRIL